MVSEQHCNFLVNTGNANATDLENLGNLVQKKVQDSTGLNSSGKLNYWVFTRIAILTVRM